MRIFAYAVLLYVLDLVVAWAEGDEAASFKTCHEIMKRVHGPQPAPPAERCDTCGGELIPMSRGQSMCRDCGDQWIGPEAMMVLAPERDEAEEDPT